MVLFLSITFTALNFILWIVMFVRFNKLFSTEDIIERTRSELNKLLRDINNNAARNVDLLEDRTKKLRALIAEADKKIQLAEQELERQTNVAAMRQQVTRQNKIASKLKPMEQRAVDSYRAASGMESQSFELTEKGEAHQESYQIENMSQGSLFSTYVEKSSEKIDTQAQVTVQKDGAATASIPVIMPKVYFNEDVIPAPQKTFAEKVMSLYNKGYGVEDISQELSCSIMEVQFVLELNN